MDFDLPSELVMLKETVSRFVNDELIPIEMESMDGPDLKPDVRLRLERKAKDLGLWLLDVPEEYGGQGLSLLGMAAVWEELARTIALPPRGPGIFGPEVRPLLFSLSPEQKSLLRAELDKPGADADLLNVIRKVFEEDGK